MRERERYRQEEQEEEVVGKDSGDERHEVGPPLRREAFAVDVELRDLVAQEAEELRREGQERRIRPLQIPGRDEGQRRDRQDSEENQQNAQGSIFLDSLRYNPSLEQTLYNSNGCPQPQEARITCLLCGARPEWFASPRAARCRGSRKPVSVRSIGA